MATTNKENTLAIHDAFSKSEFDKVLELCQDDVEAHAHAFGATFKGKEGFIGFMQSFKTAFPDIIIRHTNLIEEGDAVAVQFVTTGTHTGTLETPAGAIPPTGKNVELNVSEFLIWENGKLKALHNYHDAATVMRQIGAL